MFRSQTLESELALFEVADEDAIRPPCKQPRKMLALRIESGRFRKS
jgi:hypothetical protein